MNDSIDRQAAIDAVDFETVSTNPEHFKSSEKFIKFMDDADIASFGKWQWANGFNTALTATTIQLKNLPSAQPERITLTEKERGMLKKMRTLHNGTYADLLDRLVASAQEDADSAYIEGYTYAESKYRKMWDEMPEIIRCKDCIHSMTNDYHPDKPRVCFKTRMCGTVRDDWFCGDAERR